MHWEDRFRALATQQNGVIGRQQLAEIDCDIHEWWRARRSGRWTALSPRVLHLRGSEIDDATRARAAVLDAAGGAHLHGPSALAWLGLPDFTLSTIHVVRTRRAGSRACDLAVVHRLRDLTAADLTVVRGIPTVTPLRAIWSEASRYATPRLHEIGVRRIGRLVDDANRTGLLPWDELHRSVRALARRGRAGSRVMADLLPKRQPGSSPTESRLEDRFEEVVAAAGLRAFERQQVVGGEAVIGRVDFRDPDLPLVVEVNSLTFHSSPSDQAADEARYAALVVAGFTVAVAWEPDVWSHPTSIEDLLRHARARAGGGHHATLHSPGCPWPHDPERIVIARRVRPLRG